MATTRHITTTTPVRPLLPAAPLGRNWPFRVASSYLGGPPDESDIIGQLWPALFEPQIWGDCCAYSTTPASAPARNPAKEPAETPEI